MDELESLEGQEVYGIIGKLINDPDTSRRRVLTTGNKAIPYY